MYSFWDQAVKCEPKSGEANGMVEFSAHRAKTLVIGFGNSVRGDDGVGVMAAEAVASWGLENVRAVAVPQLVPELAQVLATVDFAVFLDACLGDQAATASCCLIDESEPEGKLISCHVIGPVALLRLGRYTYGSAPRSWLITIPAVDMRVGDRLSITAERGLSEALSLTRELLIARTEPIATS
jgi:hydrogenase maturation protease